MKIEIIIRIAFFVWLINTFGIFAFIGLEIPGFVFLINGIIHVVFFTCLFVYINKFANSQKEVQEEGE